MKTPTKQRRELDESALCQIGPRHVGPLKIQPSANRPPPPVEYFHKYKLSIEFIDLHKAFDWVAKDIFQHH